MSFKVKMKPVSVIKARLGLEPDGKTRKEFTHLCKMHMDKYLPYRDGTLANSIEEGTDYVHYLVPYAHYVYEGKVMGPNVPIKRNGIIVGWFSPIKPKYYTGKDMIISQSMNPLATSHWDKKMWSAEKDDVIKTLQKSIKRRS